MTLEDRPIHSSDDAKRLLCELGKRFYELGWVSGTGGGISVKHGGRIYMAPSGVQKELLAPESIFELDEDGEVKGGPPAASGFTMSQCRPLFLAAMRAPPQGRGAGAVIHTHGKHALFATLAFEREVVLTELEMMKGLAGVGYDDVHAVPIIENTAQECDLTDTLSAAIRAYPKAHAVLVRRHGMYVWGKDWREAKRHAECYDYLLDVAVKMQGLSRRGL